MEIDEIDEEAMAIDEPFETTAELDEHFGTSVNICQHWGWRHGLQPLKYVVHCLGSTLPYHFTALL